jgi:hypothetical protein
MASFSLASLAPVAVERIPTREWREQRTLEDSADVRVIVALRHAPSALQRLNEALHLVSQPRSTLRGQHWSLEEVTSLMGAPQSTIDMVMAFLTASGAEGIELLPSQDFVRARMLAGRAAAAFSTSLSFFEHDTRSPIVRATSDVALPEALAALVDFVAFEQGVPLRRQRSRSATGAVNRTAPRRTSAGVGDWDNDCGGQPVGFQVLPLASDAALA